MPAEVTRTRLGPWPRSSLDRTPRREVMRWQQLSRVPQALRCPHAAVRCKGAGVPLLLRWPAARRRHRRGSRGSLPAPPRRSAPARPSLEPLSSKPSPSCHLQRSGSQGRRLELSNGPDRTSDAAIGSSETLRYWICVSGTCFS